LNYSQDNSFATGFTNYLKLLFDPQLEVFTIKDKKRQGKLNGELLRLIIRDSIEIFITNDKNLRYQQKLNELDFKNY
jgi:hypothetical protein